MDVTEAKQTEETLRESEAYLAEAQRLSRTGSRAWAPATGEIRHWSEESHRMLGFDPHGGQPRFETSRCSSSLPPTMQRLGLIFPFE